MRVITHVDEAIRGLVHRDVFHGDEVEVVFDAPTRDWAARQNAPTVNAYLYDIREDVKRRERGMINEYDSTQRVVRRRQPDRHFKLSYLITAWTRRVEDEHQLLTALLACLLRHERIPVDLLTGPLDGATVPLSIGLPPSDDRSFGDIWSALGGELKPSLDLVVIAPIDPAARYEAGPPVRQPATLRFVDTTIGAAESTALPRGRGA